LYKLKGENNMETESATITLTVTITLLLNGESKQDAVNRIAGIPTSAAGNGLFTGDGPATVENWSADIDVE
jgi:hypothetical protein